MCLSLVTVMTTSVHGAKIETFGSGVNQFQLTFESIDAPGNPADNTGNPIPAGAVPYRFWMQKYEVSRDQVIKANASGGLGIDLEDMTSYGGNGVDKPATGISWFEAAKFVNWLNTEKGAHVAYKFDYLGNFQLWGTGDAGYDPYNKFRNKLARFALPTIDEWYKSAYYDPGNNTYYNFPQGSDAAPSSVTSGNLANTAVYNVGFSTGPANVTQAGGLSPYAIMGMGGNVFEWQETEADLVNDSISAHRASRGGSWIYEQFYLNANWRIVDFPTNESLNVGFRVVEFVPEPGSIALATFGICTMLATGLGRRARRHPGM